MYSRAPAGSFATLMISRRPPLRVTFAPLARMRSMIFSGSGIDHLASLDIDHLDIRPTELDRLRLPVISRALPGRLVAALRFDPRSLSPDDLILAADDLLETSLLPLSLHLREKL